jgi:hypothetical protein
METTLPARRHALDTGRAHLAASAFAFADEGSEPAHRTTRGPRTRPPADVTDRTSPFTRPCRRQALRWLAVGRTGERALPAPRPEDLFAAALGVPTGRNTR